MLEPGQVHARARSIGGNVHGLGKALLGLGKIVGGNAGRCLFTKVVRQPPLETALALGFQSVCNLRGVFPVAGAFVVGKQCQMGLRLKAGAVELEQCLFRTVQQTSLEVVQCQRVLGAVSVVLCQVSA